MYGDSEEDCGFSANDTAGGPLEQIALLFTMASLHPAFHFHQRQVVRELLDKIELAMEEGKRHRQRRSNVQATVMSNKPTLAHLNPKLAC